MKNKYLPLIYFIFTGILLLLVLPGKIGNPKIEELVSNLQWVGEGSIFDNSSPRARFATIYSLLEDKSYTFSLLLARFSTPDLAITDGKYVSLFPPGVSILATPGYLIGRYFNLSQVGAFATISIFAYLNFIFIYLISRRLGASQISSLLGSSIFLFATPSFAYSATLYQHHITVFLILVSIYASIVMSAFWASFVFFFLLGVALLVDYPNVFFFAPVGIFLLNKIINIKSTITSIQIKINPWILTSILAFAISMIPFFWLNSKFYGNPFQLAGTLKRVQAIDSNGFPIYEAYLDKEKDKKQIEKELASEKISYKFFNSRLLLSGLHTHLISEDRGMLYYAPIILFGLVFALISAYLFFAVLAVTFCLFLTSHKLSSMKSQNYF